MHRQRLFRKRGSKQLREGDIIMSQFIQILSKENIQQLIKSAFDTNLPVSGGWGYNQQEATILESNEDALPLSQIEHMLASMRTYLEMNMTLEKEDRYGSINLNELSRKTIEENGSVYDKVTYEISAMKETSYTDFITEYKEKYGKKDFDLEEHFKRRKKETLTRVVTHWFEVGKLL